MSAIIILWQTVCTAVTISSTKHYNTFSAFLFSVSDLGSRYWKANWEALKTIEEASGIDAYVISSSQKFIRLCFCSIQV